MTRIMFHITGHLLIRTYGELDGFMIALTLVPLLKMYLSTPLRRQ